MTTSRRILGGSSLQNDPQAAFAAQALNNMGDSAARRYEADADLSKIYPSPDNPRWVTLRQAGVCLETLDQFKIGPKEPVESWRNRQEEYLTKLLTEEKIVAHGVWQDLFSLANSVYKGGIDQPITALFSGEIVMGERRWSAAYMAGRPRDQVLFRNIPEEEVDLKRLTENIQRSGFVVAEICIGIRRALLKSKSIKGALSPDNREISVELLQSLMGCGRTQATYYRALCCLPEEDPLLEQIVNGGYTSLRTAYEHASARLRELNSQPPQTPPAAPEGQNPSQDGNGKRTPQPGSPQVKFGLPGTVGGLRLLNALKSIEGMPPEVATELDTVKKTWHAAPERARKRLLTDAFDKVLQALRTADEQEEDDEREAGGVV